MKSLDKIYLKVLLISAYNYNRQITYQYEYKNYIKL